MLKSMNISQTRATRRIFVEFEQVDLEFFKKTTTVTQIHDDIEFERRENLVYHFDRLTLKTRLCISKSLMKEIFQMTHDDLTHTKFHRVYAAIVETLYIRRLAHYLRQYIAYCSQCFLNQIKRHKFYEMLNSTSSFKISFHTIVMNFILALSLFIKYDTMLIVTNKFFKEKLLILD